jgi:hypothetical protein
MNDAYMKRFNEDPGFREFVKQRSSIDPFGDNTDAELKEYTDNIVKRAVDSVVDKVRASLAAKPSEPKISEDGL